MQAEKARQEANAKQKEQQARESHQLTASQQKELDKYLSLITSQIQQHWRITDAHIGIKCKLEIQLGPQGDVLSVKLVSGSGDKTLDHAAIAAVYKASPLPMPEKADLAVQLKKFRLNFKPSRVI